MAWQTPSFSFLHAAADAGVGALTASDDPDSTAYALDNLVDYNLSSLWRFNTSGAHYVDLDRGAAGLEAIDRLIIPVGHNIHAVTCYVYSSTTGAFAGEEGAAKGSGIPVADTLFDLSLTSTTERYLRFAHTTAGKAQYPQLIYTRRRTPTRGPDPYWDARKVSNNVSVPLPNRTVSLALAPPRWLYTVEWNHLESTDLAIFDDLITAVGVDNIPFWFDGMDSTLDPFYMKIARHGQRKQGRQNPQNLGPAYLVALSMLEQIG